MELNQLSGLVADAGADIGQSVQMKKGGRRVIDSISSLFIHFELPEVQQFINQISYNLEILTFPKRPYSKTFSSLE